MQLKAELRGSVRRPSDQRGTLKNLHFLAKESRLGELYTLIFMFKHELYDKYMMFIHETCYSIKFRVSGKFPKIHLAGHLYPPGNTCILSEFWVPEGGNRLATPPWPLGDNCL